MCLNAHGKYSKVDTVRHPRFMPEAYIDQAVSTLPQLHIYGE